MALNETATLTGVASSAGLGAEVDMTDEERDLLYAYKAEMEKLHDLAQRLDAFSPETRGAFTGTPSERIERQLRAMQAPGFESA